MKDDWGFSLSPKFHKFSPGRLASLVEPMACMVTPVPFHRKGWFESVVQFPAYHASLVLGRIKLVHLGILRMLKREKEREDEKRGFVSASKVRILQNNYSLLGLTKVQIKG